MSLAYVDAFPTVVVHVFYFNIGSALSCACDKG